MKKITTLLMLTGLMIGSFLPVNAQENQFSDNYDYTDVNTDVYRPDGNGSHVFSIDGEALKVTVNKVEPWDGFVIEFPQPLDMSEFPYASMKIKTDKKIDFRIYLWDKDSLYARSDITLSISPSN